MGESSNSRKISSNDPDSKIHVLTNHMFCHKIGCEVF